MAVLYTGWENIGNIDDRELLGVTALEEMGLQGGPHHKTTQTR